MPVMRLEVPRANWNNLQIAAVKAGLDMEPDEPSTEDESTPVEISGSLEMLQLVLIEGGKEVALIDVLPLLERR
jgi:hypothetical protein